jgi:hypothetical protein
MPKQELPSPRVTSLLALEALDRYLRSGLAHPGEDMPAGLAVRLARVARSNKWEKK